MPERPYLGRGDDEEVPGIEWLRRGQLAQAWVEGAEQAGADGDVVRSLRGGDADGGHGGVNGNPRGCQFSVVRKCKGGQRRWC